MSERSAQTLGSAIIAASGGVACSGGMNSIAVGIVILAIFGPVFLRSCIVAEREAEPRVAETQA